MLKRHLSQRLKLGTFLGIDLFIHWTFWLLLIGMGGWSLAAGEGWQLALIRVTQLVALFVCVTLHEYGHAMAARQFNVRTVDITLLPIGGLARLERMPRVPWQEFLVAIAGPAVNVVIAAVIGTWLIITDPAILSGSLDVTTLTGFLLVVNIGLVLFNMLPAFPMDGGRVLRSLLAMILEYRRATRIAARIGLVVAVGMALIGLWNFLLVPVLVAAFIGYAGWMESQQVEVSEAVRGVRVEEGMVRDVTSVDAMTPLDDLVAMFAERAERSVPVVGIDSNYLGMLDVGAVAAAARDGRTGITAMELMRRDLPAIEAPGSLEAEMQGFSLRNIPVLPVVDVRGRLLGVLDFGTLGERVMIARRRREMERSHEPPIEARLISAGDSESLTDTYI